MGAKILTLVLLVGAIARAQVPADAGAELQQMASHAAVIFAGQVVAVSRNDAAGYVEVRFRIDQAVRGCPKSGAYVLREWAGLWSGHAERYAVGQRRLMLLTARSRDGFSAPVGGLDGAIPLVATGVQPLAHGIGVAEADSALASVAFAADLRWVQARATRVVSPERTVSARVQAVGVPAQPMPDPAAGDWVGPVAPMNSSAAASPSKVSLASLLALLGTRAKGVDARF